MDRKYFNQYIGNELFKSRVVQRITQEQFVKKTNKLWLTKYEPNRKNGVSRATYSRYETGEISIPFLFFKASCDILKLDWIRLFEDATKYEICELIKDCKKIES